MNKKILLAVSSALYGASLGAVADSAKPTIEGMSDSYKLTQAHAIKKESKSFVRSKLSEKIHLEDGLTGKYNYIVRLTDAPVASYRGGINGFEATSPAYTKSFKERSILAKGRTSAEKRTKLKLDVKKPAVNQYANYLTEKQSEMIAESSKILGTQIKPLARMKYALNAVVMSLTQEEAAKIAKLKNVDYVEREQMYSLDTDTGPNLIGAPNVWDGTATGVGAMGEGVIIGVIDTGINTDHPSFADVGGDDYDHTNPWGNGVYVGDCAGAFPELCNDKLIGVHSYTEITNDYSNDPGVFGATPPPANGEDYNGHGSHTASTAGGNILLNVPLLDTENGVEEGDGVNSTGFEFAQISGVAPHANIVAYQICRPGDTGDTYASCPSTAINLAIDDAITDGVDVINYSISGGGNPWNSSTEQAYLAAQDAGIFVATSAGNSGPNAYTTSKNAPWYTAVAASTHGRTLDFTMDFGGATYSYTRSSGPYLGADLTAPVTYSGAIDAANFEGCSAFAADTFTDSIALISRGSCSFSTKVNNAEAAGAVAVIVFNNSGETTTITMSTPSTSIPSVMVSQNDGASMVASLTAAPGTEAAIAIAPTLVMGQADDLASFSSRGPNATVADIMTPSVAAPGVSVYAAYADQQFGHDVTGPAPADFAFLSGTSMASPHVAGAGALLKSAHPSWTPDNIRSALMLTATSDMRKEDGVTPADIFDMGSGRIRVDLAAKTGLIMDETEANYTAANPDDGGDPKTLNIPSMGNTACSKSCSWQRTFTATKDGSWTTSATSSSGGAVVTVSPASFSILEGETQTITVSVELQLGVDGLVQQEDVTGVISLTSTDTSVPTAKLPMFLKVANSNLPTRIDMEVHRDAGSVVLRNNLGVSISDFTPSVFGLTKANRTSGAVGQDSDVSSPFDDLTDGGALSWLTLDNSSKFLHVGIADAGAPDFDLYVGIDANNDGLATPDELLCVAATGATNEVCEIEQVESGSYWILVNNYEASAPDAEDKFTLVTGYVANESNGNLTLTAQDSADDSTPFDIRMNWSDEMQQDDLFIGAFNIATDASGAAESLFSTTLVLLTRGEDDVQLSVDDDSVAVGDKVDFTITLPANMTDEDAYYSVNANIPEGITVDPDSIVSSSGNASLIGGGIDGVNINWAGYREGLLGKEPSYTITDNNTDASCVLPDFGQGGGYIDLSAFGVGPQPLDGDTVSAEYAIAIPFLGASYPSFTITDDGFVSFTGNTGSAPWVNQFLPSGTQPNGLVAPFWRDMQLDTASGSAAYVATAGSYVIIEFQAMRPYDYYNGDPSIGDVLDFEVVIDRSNGDIVYGYNAVTHDVTSNVTVGWENAAGTSGYNHIYAGSAGSVGSLADITSGLLICHKVKEVDSSSVTINFSGTIDASAAGATLTSTLTSDSTNVGAQEEASYVSINVATNLALTAIADNTVAEDTTLTGIVVEYTDVDAVDNTITVTSPDGVASNISGGASGSTFDITPNQDFVGDMVVTVTVTDNEKPADSVSTTFTVNVTNVNDAPSASPSAKVSGGGGKTDAKITLRANGSDIDGDDLTYSWTQISGHSVTISNATSATATVENANEETGDLTFQVTVSDGALESTATVTVHVTKAYSGDGAFGWMLLVLLGALGIGRRR